MLSYTNRRHVTSSYLEAAIKDIINAYNRLSLPKCWGSGKKAAADGSKFEIYENNLLSEYHIRYGGYGGIAYHHVSDTYIALFTHFISCGVWEAVYILDGLLKNTSNMTRVIQSLNAEGFKINRRMLATMSPYINRNLKRYGDYVVDLKNIPQPFEGAINLPIDIFET